MTAPAAHTRPRAGSAVRQHVGRSRPARFLPTWPAEMRADVAAAFLDFETTGQMFKAMLRNEAPRPTSSRMRDGRREPLWSLDALRAYVAHRHHLAHDARPGWESIEALI
jgi:hypothetical protein